MGDFTKTIFRSLVLMAAGLGMLLAWRIGSDGELRWHDNQRQLARQRDAILAASSIAGDASKSVSLKKPIIPPDGRRRELVKLRAESVTLDETAERLTAKLASQSSLFKRSMPAPEAIHFGEEAVSNVLSNQDTELYLTELENAALRKGDARRLTSVVRLFARENEGQLPSSFLEALASVDGSDRIDKFDAFELVFQGNTDDLGMIPLNAVALIRERKPWRTPSGKLARIYGMLGGFIRIVESDDDFVAWETAHIVPSISR